MLEPDDQRLSEAVRGFLSEAPDLVPCRLSNIRLINPDSMEVQCQIGSYPWAIWEVPDGPRRGGQRKFASGLHPGDVLTFETSTGFLMVGVVTHSTLKKTGLPRGLQAGGRAPDLPGSDVVPGCESARILGFRIVISCVRNSSLDYVHVTMASLEAVTFIKHISKTSGIATPRIFRQILRMEAWQTELLTGQVGRDDTLCLPFLKTPARPWALDLNKCILQFLTSAPPAGIRPADLIGTANEFEEDWESWTTTGDRPLYPRPQALSTLSRQLWSLWQDSPLQHFRVAAAANDDMGTVYTQSSLQDAQVSLATAASAWRNVMTTMGLIADGIPEETCVIFWRLHALYVQGGVISPAHSVMLPAMATFTDTLHEQKNVLLLTLK
jgi:hypothetical protein